jgi:hypothetical protein
MWFVRRAPLAAVAIDLRPNESAYRVKQGKAITEAGHYNENCSSRMKD